MKANKSHSFQQRSHFSGFTLIELLVVIAIIAILAVVVVLTLNPAQLLAQSRDASRVSDMATLTSALNLYTTDQAGVSTFSLGNASDTYISIYDLSATSTAGDQCQGLSVPSLNTFTGQSWQCAASTTPRTVNGTGWLPVNFTNISAGSPLGSLPVDPVNQTSTGLFYAYNTNGPQFEVTANLESQKYKTQYGSSVQTSLFPEVISGGTQGISALYNPSGLVGYWNFDEGSGTIAYDTSGNNNNGTWNGSSSYAAGKVGNYAGGFNGNNDYVAISAGSALEALSNTGSISAWIDYSLSTSSLRTVVDLGGTGTHGLVLFASDAGPNQPVFQYGSGAATILIGAPTIPVGTWYLIAGTWAPSGAGLYINGVLVASTSTAPSITPYSTTMYIGTNGGGSRYMDGEIDDVRVYNRALSAAEVMALYNAEH
jgi:prepilin-type N-terminal cleavage/methylation domain-containing protein